MTSLTETPQPFGTAPALAPLHAKSGWIIALGVIYVIAGLIALASIVEATVVSVFIVGIMMLIAGVAEVFHAFQVKSWGKFLLWVLLGALYIVAGLVTFENPLLAAAILTLILGIALVASGIMRIILAFSVKEGAPWIWVVVSGIITLLLGLIILAHWPVSSLYILGLFLGVDLVFAGAGWIGLGFGLRRTAPSR
ncbi:MAG: HdeD family acid-resistance protein [Alphaproteobacteria bacterium]|nr:HdeD family acid-resistance protein [Alphaproteobacteria bacterium]